jgi:hypothetical protein
LSFTETLRAQWSGDLDDTISRVKSEWLLQQIDVRLWSHVFGSEDSPNAMRSRYIAQILSLALGGSAIEPNSIDRYWKWLDDRVIAPLRDEQPHIYESLVNQVRSTIREAVLNHNDSRYNDQPA